VTEAFGPGHCPSVERNARALASLLPLLLATSACIVDLGKLGEEDTDTDDGASETGDPSGGGSDGGSSNSGGDDGDTEDPGTPMPTEREVDILLVIDNSGSMGEEQAKLAGSIDALAGMLDAATPPVDYRIAVTTTDNGNPWCGATTPEAGRLRASSCRSRPGEFVFEGAVVIDAFDEACASICPEGMVDLTIDDGAPWVDVRHSLGTDNVGGAVGDNLRCMLPQGINGCGFEQPLESIWKAIQRFGDPMEDSFGFHRPGALFAVLIVSDEVDCSHNPQWEDIFVPQGQRTFWTDPQSASPTSGVCWNAGMACTDDGAGGLDCMAENYDIDGNPDADSDASVLYPVGRYTSALAGTAAYVAGIYGVGLDGSVTYQPSPDPQFQNDFGIGPGCESASATAVPPARTMDVVTALGGGHYSICADGFQGPFVGFAQGILARLP
jgi:hypothetical protein